MKIAYLLAIAATMLALTACEKQTTADKVTDKVGDALNTRPHEKIRDAAEDAKDAVKDSAAAVKQEAKDATKK